MSGHPEGSGGAISMAEAGQAGTTAVACLLIHVPADQMGTPAHLWPGTRVMNHHQEVLGVDVDHDVGYRIRAVPPDQVEVTQWRRGTQLSCVLAPAGHEG